MAYVNTKDFNDQLAKIGNATLYSGDNVKLSAKNIDRISGDLEKFNFVDLMTALSYKEASVKVSSSLASLVYELGTTVYGGHTLTTTVASGTSPIAQIEFFKDDVSVSVITQNVSNGGNFTYASSTNITADETYKVVVTCEDGSTVEDTLSVRFYNPYYHGVTARRLDELTQADITVMTKDVIAKSEREYRYTSNNEFCVMAYPKEHGLLSSILDSNGFQNIDSMSYIEMEINNIPYYVYQTNSLVICTDFLYVFKY